MTRWLVAVAAVLAAALPVPSGAMAASRPRADLVIARLGGVPAHARPGGRISLRYVLANRGRAAAGRSKTAFLLSRDRRRSAGDVRLGASKAGRVGGRSARRRHVWVGIPRSTGPGHYRVLACVDAGHRVRERRERGNCRASSRRLRVVPASGGPPHPLPTAPATPATPALPAPGSCFNAADRSAPDIGVAVRPLPPGTQGRVLPGRALASQVVDGVPATYHDPVPDGPHYPGGALPQGPPAWRGLQGISPDRLIHATSADARFNGPDVRYRVAFHLSHFGGMPDTAGDFNGDGVQDLVISEHFSYVDGMQYAGEVHVYLGRRGEAPDPAHRVPDMIFYGDEAGAKLGISVARAGDVNGDGRDDLLMAAAFHSVHGAGGRVIPNAGTVYVVYGGFLERFGCPVKVRAEDIGSKVPGLVLEGGHDGGGLVGWANGLDAGDFDGDGISDVVIGSYDPYPGGTPTFPARAYLLHGSRSLPQRLRGYRLGVDGLRDGVSVTTLGLDDGEETRQSYGFGAFFAGDLTGDGRDELAFTAGKAGADGRGAAYLIDGRPGPLPAGRIAALADTTISADDMSSPALRFMRIGSVRPAGDVNGDGLADALITARGTQAPIDGAWTRVGAVGILHGRPTLPPTLGFSQLDTILHGRQEGWIGQPAMDRGADFDGDGYADVVVNDPYYREPIGGELQLRGRLWIVRGGPALPHTIDVETAADRYLLADTRIPGMFGFTWNTGDWNGDGRPDLVVGDHYAGDAELHEHAGLAYVFLGGSSLTLP